MVVGFFSILFSILFGKVGASVHKVSYSMHSSEPKVRVGYSLDTGRLQDSLGHRSGI